MTSFDGVTAVNAELERLGSLPEPLVLQLPRRPGQKEERWIQLLAPEGNAVVDSGAVRMDARRGLDLEALSAAAPFAVDGATEVGQARATPTGSELGALMAAVTTLRAEVAAFACPGRAVAGSGGDTAGRSARTLDGRCHRLAVAHHGRPRVRFAG